MIYLSNIQLFAYAAVGVDASTSMSSRTSALVSQSLINSLAMPQGNIFDARDVHPISSFSLLACTICSRPNIPMFIRIVWHCLIVWSDADRVISCSESTSTSPKHARTSSSSTHNPCALHIFRTPTAYRNRVYSSSLLTQHHSQRLRHRYFPVTFLILFRCTCIRRKKGGARLDRNGTSGPM